MTIKTDKKGRTWDTEEVALDSIEFALERPDITGWTPTREQLSLLQLHRPEVILAYKLKHNPRIRNLPPEEQEPFSKWLLGQTMPYIEGIPKEEQDFYYQVDYDRWKAGLEPLD